MQTRKSFPFLLAVALVALAAASAFAQVGRIEGDVKKKGTGEPIPNATVAIIRDDIKGDYTIKADKKGHFIHAGVPAVGRYTVMVSADGFAPDARLDVRPTGELMVFELNPGDGHKLTIEEVKKGVSSSPAAAGTKNVAESKKQQEEYAKKIAEVAAKNEKIKADFEKMKQLFESGRMKFNNKDWAGAITDYKEAVALDADQHVIHGNLGLAYYNNGVTLLNDSIKDPSKRDPAKQALTDAVASAGQAIKVLETSTASDAAKANSPETKQTKAQYIKIKADSESLLGKRFADSAMADAANKDYMDLAAMTDDAAKKKEYVFKGAETLREAGKNEAAIAAYKTLLEQDPNYADALYGLGVAYASQESTFQNAADTLQAFVDKAPNDPRAGDAKAVIEALRVGNNIKPVKPAKEATGGARKKKG